MEEANSNSTGGLPRVPSNRFLISKVDREPPATSDLQSVSTPRQVKFETDPGGDKGDESCYDSTAHDGTSGYYGKGRKSVFTERMPNIDHYRNSIAAGAGFRPTLMDLHKPVEPSESRFAKARGSIFGKRLSMSPTAKLDRNANKFGWIQGVLVRCVLNILGVMLYLRLSWVAGQAGIILGTVIVLLGSVVTTLTALSMSAISTNGEIRGGGAYFMISRSLGPEFGGSIGVIFTIANNVGAAMYIVGFSETVRDLMQENGAAIVNNGYWDVTIVSWATAVLLFGVVIAGVSFEAKAQLVLLFILVVSLVNYVVGTFIPPSALSQARGVTGYRWATFSGNMLPMWRKGEEFFSVFAVYFPAATGIMAGANISGDLTNPQKAIPKGTLLAILITTVLYVGGVSLTGATCLRDASGDVSDLINGTLTECAENFTCKYGLLNFYQVMEMESAWGPLITAGIFAATLSSALASLVSAPKILQAVGRDKLFPYLDFFSKSYGKADEPRRGYVLTFVICMAVIAIGDLNAIAPIISNFFLASYGLVNYACFDASFSGSPGFRPSFKYYNKWVSLLGALLCVGVMFVISWWTALVTFAFILVLYVYLHRSKPDVNWGSSTQANSYKSALKKLQKLQSVEEHVKNFRPQILLLSGTPTNRPALLDFVYNITKDNSLLICGDFIIGEANHVMLANVRQLSKQVSMWLTKRKVKAFYYPILADNLRQGVLCLLQSAGIGKLKPNILFLGYKTDWRTCDADRLADYFNAIHYGFEFNMGVGIFRSDKSFDISRTEEEYDEDENADDAAPLHDDDLEAGRARFSDDDDDDDEESEILKRQPSAPVVDEALRLNADLEVEKKVSQISIGLQPDENLIETSAPRRLSVRYFRTKLKKATVDVWWLYDDGGLSLLVPYLLTLSKSYLEGANLRVFTVASSRGKLESEQRSMAALLSKFRIDYKEVFVIPDSNSTKPSDASALQFAELIAPFVNNDISAEDDSIYTSDAELLGCEAKTNRHLRIRELLNEYSSDVELVVLTLPVPRRGSVSASLYMAWLETLSRDMPPMLFMRGNQQSVLTFYS